MPLDMSCDLNNRRPILFKNVNSGSCPGWAAMQIVSKYTRDDGAFVFTCDQYGGSGVAANFNNIIFNGPVAVAANAYGVAYLSPPVEAAYDTGTPAVGDLWGVKSGQWALTQYGLGGFVVDGLLDTNSKRMLGRWMGTNVVIGKCSSSISKGSSGSMLIYTGTPGGESSSGVSITTYANGAAITSGKWCSAQWFNNAWYVGCWES